MKIPYPALKAVMLLVRFQGPIKYCNNDSPGPLVLLLYFNTDTSDQYLVSKIENPSGHNGLPLAN